MTIPIRTTITICKRKKPKAKKEKSYKKTKQTTINMKKINVSTIIAMVLCALFSCQKGVDAPNTSTAVNNLTATGIVTQAKKDTVNVDGDGDMTSTGYLHTWSYLAVATIWLPNGTGKNGTNDYEGYKITRTVWTLHKTEGLIHWTYLKQWADQQSVRQDVFSTQARDLKVVFTRDSNLIPDDVIPEMHYLKLQYRIAEVISPAQMTSTIDSIYIEHHGIPCVVKFTTHQNRIVNF